MYVNSGTERMLMEMQGYYPRSSAGIVLMAKSKEQSSSIVTEQRKKAAALYTEK